MKNNPTLLVDLIASLAAGPGMTSAPVIAGMLGADEFAVYDELLRLARLGRVKQYRTRTLPSRRLQLKHDTFHARAR